MRPTIATLVGALAIWLLRGQTYSGVLRPNESRPPLLDLTLQLGAVALVALLIGFAVKRRGWLAAALAYAAGVGLWVVVELRPSPPWVPTDVGGTWETVSLAAVIGGVWSAVFGAAGSFAARALDRRARLKAPASLP